jgi:hypothetical protein
MPKIAAVLFFCFLSHACFAQEAPGGWTGGGLYKPGESVSEALKSLGGEKKIVIQINRNGEITGTLDASYNRAIATRAHDGVDATFLIGGRYDSANHKLLLAVTHLKGATSAIADRKFKYPDSLYYTVQVVRQGGTVSMTGAADVLGQGVLTAEWLSSNRGSVAFLTVSGKLNMHVLPLNIQLEKSAPFAETMAAAAPPPIKNDPAAAPPPIKDEPAPARPQIDKRKTEIQHTIYLDTSLIKLDMYDNGDVDGDIATLILDGNAIINNQLLSTKAASVTINISTDKKEHFLELYANNLGSIPPNTALVVLTCNRKRYEINLSSNGTQNGTVRLVLGSK